MANKAVGPGMVALGVLGLVIIVLIATSLKKLASNELGLKYDNIAKSLGSEVQYEGLHLGAPGFSFIIFPSVYETMQFNDITVSIFLSLIIKLPAINQDSFDGSV